MIESGEYPAGTEYSKNAPWNEHLNKPVKVNVTVSMTLSKEFEVEVDDYSTDDEGKLDFSDCDLKAAARDQIYLPDDAGDNLEWVETFFDTKLEPNYDSSYRNMVKDLKGWNVDDFEVVTDD